MKPESRETRPAILEPSSRRFSESMSMQYRVIRPVNIYTIEPQVLLSDDVLPQKLSSLLFVSNAVLSHSHSMVSFLDPACPNLRAKALGSGRQRFEQRPYSELAVLKRII